jgi:predicted Zn-dependent protease with MMP-like domain
VGERIRRDRHGRGLRGPLLPASLPAAATRSEQFDALVVEVLEPIEARFAEALDNLDVAVDDVPDVRWVADGSDMPGLLLDGSVPLSRLVPVGVDGSGLPTRARIVLYRRPLEARAKDPEELAELVHDVLIEQIAGYLGIEPDSLD